MAGMSLNSFADRSERLVTQYFGELEARLAAGGVSLAGANGEFEDLRWPKQMVIYELPDHFGAELLGSQTAAADLHVIRKPLASVQSFLGQFDQPGHEAMFRLGESEDDAPSPGRADGPLFSTLKIFADRDKELIVERYPEADALQNSESSLIFAGELEDDQAFTAISGVPRNGSVWLTNVLTISSWASIVRARYFQAAWLVPKSVSSSAYKIEFEKRFPSTSVLALLPPTGDSRVELLAAMNFASLASMDKIGEVTLTTFLEQNEAILLGALKAKRLIAQPLLPWIEGNPDDEEEAIQPDFLFEDEEGRTHICEVKLPLLDRKNLTTGGHRRRRVIQPVMDGLAQLANYQDYFSREPHRQLLRERYSLEIDSPTSVLIVGSSENYDAGQVREALRMHTPVKILDFDTLRALALLSSGALNL